MHILSSLHNDYFLVIQRNQLYLIKCQNELSIECIYWHSVYLLILILLNTIQKSSGTASLGASALSMLHMVSVTKVCNNHPFLYLGTNCLWGRALWKQTICSAILKLAPSKWHVQRFLQRPTDKL